MADDEVREWERRVDAWLGDDEAGVVDAAALLEQAENVMSDPFNIAELVNRWGKANVASLTKDEALALDAALMVLSKERS